MTCCVSCELCECESEIVIKETVEGAIKKTAICIVRTPRRRSERTLLPE